MSSSSDEYGFKIFFCDLSTVKWNEIEQIVSDLQHSAIDELGHDAPQEIDFIFGGREVSGTRPRNKCSIYYASFLR